MSLVSNGTGRGHPASLRLVVIVNKIDMHIRVMNPEATAVSNGIP